MSARSGLVGKKNLLALFGAISGQFFMGRNNADKYKIVPIFLGGPVGPIHPVWDQWRVHLPTHPLRNSMAGIRFSFLFSVSKMFALT